MLFIEKKTRALKCRKDRDKTATCRRCKWHELSHDSLHHSSLSLFDIGFILCNRKLFFCMQIDQFHRNIRIGKQMVYLALTIRCKNETLYRISRSSFPWGTTGQGFGWDLRTLDWLVRSFTRSGETWSAQKIWESLTRSFHYSRSLYIEHRKVTSN